MRGWIFQNVQTHVVEVGRRRGSCVDCSKRRQLTLDLCAQCDSALRVDYKRRDFEAAFVAHHKRYGFDTDVAS